MNQAHWHLVLNHLPIIFPFAGLLLLASGFIFKSDSVRRAAYGIFIAGALFTIPAYSTGEGAEEVVEQIQGMDERYMEIHEEAAETFAILSYILGGLALLALALSRKPTLLSQGAGVAVLVIAVVVLFFAKQVGTTGGEIRHTEIRAGNAVNTSTQQTAPEQAGAEDDD